MGAGETVSQGIQKAGLLQILRGSFLIAATTSPAVDTALVPGEHGACLHLNTPFRNFP